MHDDAKETCSTFIPLPFSPFRTKALQVLMRLFATELKEHLPTSILSAGTPDQNSCIFYIFFVGALA